MSTRRGKALFGGGLVVFGLAVFMLASAYLIARDQPKWLAAAVGALAFPVLPVTWHVLGERRRRRRLAAEKTPPKTTLAPGDRYLMRAVVVAAAVLAPMFVIGRFDVLRAAWDHKAWFLPDDFDAIGDADELMAHVPADADAVLVVREHEDNKTSGELGMGVVAYADRQLAMIAPAGPSENSSDKVAEFNEQRSKIPFFKLEKVEAVSLGKRMFAVASERWASAIKIAGAGPRAAIKNELAKAPSDAVVSLAYVPAKPVDGIEKLTGWMIQKGVNEKMTIEGRVDAVDAPSAEKFVDVVRALWKVQRTELPAACREDIEKLTGAIELDRKGATVTFHLVLQPEQLVGLMLCGIKD